MEENFCYTWSLDSLLIQYEMNKHNYSNLCRYDCCGTDVGPACRTVRLTPCYPKWEESVHTSNKCFCNDKETLS